MTKHKQTKRALISSMLSLVLCFTMLLGTTFAWFTDSASTAVNKIQAGTLDVALEMKDADGNWVNAEDQTLNFVDMNGNSDILWEPNATFKTTEFRVVNDGNLALKYQFIINGINGDAKLNDAIEWSYEYIFANGSAANYSLTDLTSSTTVLKPAGTDLGDFEARGFRIVGHMKEEAGNEYQGLSIDGISITVIATQAQYENDIDGNTYDKDATYPEAITAAELKEIMTPDANGVITLNQNYVLTDSWTSLSGQGGKTITINGNGHYIAGLTTSLLADNYCANLTINDLTIKDAVITYTSVTGAGNGAFVGYMTGYPVVFNNCHIDNVTVNGVEGKNLQVGGFAGQLDATALTIKNCTAKNSTINANSSAGGFVGLLMTNNGITKTIENSTVTNCKINSSDNGNWRIGAIVGTVNGDGALTISNCSESGNTYAMNNSATIAPANKLYGRTVGSASVN